jgi:hypothetical protein
VPLDQPNNAGFSPRGSPFLTLKGFVKTSSTDHNFSEMALAVVTVGFRLCYQVVRGHVPRATTGILFQIGSALRSWPQYTSA